MPLAAVVAQAAILVGMEQAFHHARLAQRVEAAAGQATVQVPVLEVHLLQELVIQNTLEVRAAVIVTAVAVAVVPLGQMARVTMAVVQAQERAAQADLVMLVMAAQVALAAQMEQADLLAVQAQNLVADTAAAVVAVGEAVTTKGREQLVACMVQAAERAVNPLVGHQMVLRDVRV